MKRRIFALFLACLMLAVSVPLSSVVAEDTAVASSSEPTIAYSLYYSDPGRGGGYVTVSGIPEDGYYWLYWGQNATTNLENYLYIYPIQVTNGVGKQELNKFLLIPEGATHLLLRKQDDAQTLVASLAIPEANLYDASAMGAYEYTFGSISDQHCVTTNNATNRNINRVFNTMGTDLKFIGDTGDLADTPYLAGYAAYNRLLDELYAQRGLSREDIPVYSGLGNHECRIDWVPGNTKGDVNVCLDTFKTDDFKSVFGDLWVTDENGNEVFSHAIYPIAGTNDYVFMFPTWSVQFDISFNTAAAALEELANTPGVGKIFMYQHMVVYNEAGGSWGNNATGCDDNWRDNKGDNTPYYNQTRWMELMSKYQNVVSFCGHNHRNFNHSYLYSKFVASDGDGDVARQVYIPSTYATTPQAEVIEAYGALAAEPLGARQDVYADAMLSYGVNLDTGVYQPVACLYMPYDEDSAISNVELPEGLSTDVFVNPADAVDGKDLSLVLTDAAGNEVNESVSYRVTDEDFNTIDASIAYVENNKLYFTDAAAKGFYHVVAQAGNHTVIFNVEYRSVYIGTIDHVAYTTDGTPVSPAAPYLWESCVVDNENHEINIVMPSYNNPLVSGYSHSGGEGYTNLISTSNVDNTSSAWPSYWGGLSKQFTKAYLYDGQQITVTSDDGTESAVYTVNLTFPAVELEGEGTKENPYKVSTLEDFQYVMGKITETPWSNPKGAWSFVGAYIEQTADISGLTPVKGTTWTQNFWAHYDGKGHTLTFDGEYEAGASAYAFCNFLRGSVKNLKIAGNLTCANGTAALFDKITSTGLLENIHSDAIYTSNTNAFILNSSVDAGGKYNNILFTGTLNGSRKGVFYGGTKYGDVYVKNPFTSSWSNFTNATDAIASGETAYKLNAYAAENGLLGWGQDLSVTDSTPELGSEKAVYVGADGYTNENPEGTPILVELLNVDTTNGASLAPLPCHAWSSYTIDHTNHTVNIVMNAYNYPRCVGYTHASGSVSLLTGVTDATAASTNNYQSLSNQYVNAYLYEGQKLTAWSADGKNSVDYTVHITFPTLDLQGAGTEENPYLIEDADDFLYIYNKFNDFNRTDSTMGWSYAGAYFRQTADISVEVTVANGNFHPICWWAHYDGAGHTLNVTGTRTSGNATLFGNKFRGSLRNITLTGSITNATTDDNRAALAAGLCAGSVIENVHSQLELTAYRTFILSSGIDSGATIKNVLFTGILNGTARGVCYGGSSLGKNVYTTFVTGMGWTNYTDATASAANGELLKTLNTYAEANNLATWTQNVGTDVAPSLTKVVYDVPNDFDGDKAVTSRDAIYLLYHTMLPEQYPVEDSDAYDFNGDGMINTDDAIYLLYSIMLPESYPL
ncbi:MAG: metallophosphoesterase [Clostridia bacterium]|nr:metallophosphoesterase [Clostridia bacterium]